MIEIQHLRKEYPSSVPLKDVNAVIREGDVISIIGPSGTGKSTLIRCINQLTIPTSGTVLMDGTDLTDPATDINQARLHIGMVFQSYNLYEHLTVIENVMLAQEKLLGVSKEQAYQNGMDLLKKVGMDTKALVYPKQLSGGQKQRAAIARTLATDPSIILFDEPTSALDPLSVGDVENLIASLADGKRIMMIVTHSMEFARKVSNRVFYMDDGGIYEDGTPEQIFDHPQKTKTRRFIFHQYNLELEFCQETFDLQACQDEIAQFCDEHEISSSRARQLQLVFEETCFQGLMETLNVQENIYVLFTYHPEDESVTFFCKFHSSNPEAAQYQYNNSFQNSVSYEILTALTTDFELSTEDECTVITCKL